MQPPPALDFQRLLDAVEDAPPVGAVQVMAEELGRSLGATEVTFLAVDLRGRQLARLTYDGVAGVVGESSERGRQSDRSAEVALPVDGVLQDVLRTQQVLVQPDDGAWRTFVPAVSAARLSGSSTCCSPSSRTRRRWPTCAPSVICSRSS